MVPLMMNRTFVGVLILITLGAAIVYFAMGQFTARCEACVAFGGRQICETAVASSPAEAEQQAIYSACSQITRGVTEIVACTGAPPRRLKCEE